MKERLRSTANHEGLQEKTSLVDGRFVHQDLERGGSPWCPRTRPAVMSFMFSSVKPAQTACKRYGQYLPSSGGPSFTRSIRREVASASSIMSAQVAVSEFFNASLPLR